MSVKSLIDEILPYCPGYNRSGNRGLLKEIQKAQDLLFDYDGAQMKWVGTDNQGWVPYLITTDNVFRYDITGANLSSGTPTRTLNGTSYTMRCRKVLRVFVDATEIDYTKRFVGAPYLKSWSNPYSSATTRMEVSDIPVDSGEALESTTAWVMFKENPGATTTKYFIEFVLEPPRLTSESVPLSVPAIYEDAIEDYVIGKIQERQNGSLSDKSTRFRNFWIPKFRDAINSGAQSYSTQTLPRFC
jgi:hypothetical protein